MIQFYLPDIETFPQLDAIESGHCIRVLRKQVGDEIICVDGKGFRYHCTIIDANPRRVSLQVHRCEEIANPWDVNISLAIAPTKNMDRMEWVCEKVTEMGINTIIPVKCTHSERKELKGERLTKILVSAMKQSLKATLPILAPMTPLEDVLNGDFQGQKFICYCGNEAPRRDLCIEYKADSDVTILIGPEGDFSPEEVQLAISCGWTPVSLGDSRLRTETAAMFAVAAIHTINQRSQTVS